MKPLTYVEKKRLYFEDKEKYEKALILLRKDKELYEKRNSNITRLHQERAFNIVKTVVIINHSEFCSFVLQGMISSLSNDHIIKKKRNIEEEIDHCFRNKKKERDKLKKVQGKALTKKWIEYYKENDNAHKKGIAKLKNWYFNRWLGRADTHFESSKINSYCDLTVVCDEDFDDD